VREKEETPGWRELCKKEGIEDRRPAPSRAGRRGRRGGHRGKESHSSRPNSRG